MCPVGIALYLAQATLTNLQGVNMKHFKQVLNVAGCSFAGAVLACLVFVVVDFILTRLGGISPYHQGELLMDRLFSPSDSLVLGFLLFIWIAICGAVVGTIVGVLRVRQ